LLANTAGAVRHHPVVLDGKGVALDVGRTQRLATVDHRRALRAMYPTCAIPDCRTAFDRCTPHHLIFWTRNGPSDLDNLANSECAPLL
jgi:hypothetical protein